ncbi:hypothetical protein R1flu_001815 [Riccia fluitans]|uniref:Uncharacterized protein n=1 Tax=Riccia fluitans TaxID=41844 RepID=A0ABD1Y4I1_9MARC
MEDEDGTGFSFDETMEDTFNMNDDCSLTRHTGESFVVEKRRRSSGNWIAGNEVRCETKEEYVELNPQLDVYVKQIQQLQEEKRDDQYAYEQITAAFEALTSEVENILASPNALESSLGDSLQLITCTTKAFQECAADAKNANEIVSSLLRQVALAEDEKQKCIKREAALEERLMKLTGTLETLEEERNSLRNLNRNAREICVERLTKKVLASLETPAQSSQELVVDRDGLVPDDNLRILETALDHLIEEKRCLHESVGQARMDLDAGKLEKEGLLQREKLLLAEADQLKGSLQTLEDTRDSFPKVNVAARELLLGEDTEVERIMNKLFSSLKSPSQKFNVNNDSSARDDILHLLEMGLDHLIEERRCLQEALESTQMKLETGKKVNERLLQRENLLSAEADELKGSLETLRHEMVLSTQIPEATGAEKELYLQREASLLDEIRELKAYSQKLESEINMLQNSSAQSEKENRSSLDRETLLIAELDQLKSALQSMQDEIIASKQMSVEAHEEREKLTEREAVLVKEVSHLRESLQLVQQERGPQDAKVTEREAVLVEEVSHLQESLQLMEQENSLQDAALRTVFSKLDSMHSSSEDTSASRNFTRLVTQVDLLLQEKIALKDSLDILQKDMQHASKETERLLRRETDLLQEVVNLQSKIHTLEKESNVMMVTHQQREAELAKRISDLEGEKEKLLKNTEDTDSQVEEFRAAADEAYQELKVWQQRYQSDSSQFRSEIMALKKELSTAKAAPAGLLKERDSLSRDLEKLKSKAKDTEAKLKSALQDKNKLETEKLNMERDLRQLRQSTSMQRDINRRDSIADQRRQSIALGLNKTRNQLSSAEHALQSKTEEVERLTYELHVAKESYSKLEFEMAEAESYSKEQVAELEKQISELRDEKSAAYLNAEKLRSELEATQELCAKKVQELEVLQEDLRNLRDQLFESDNNIRSAQLSAAELAREKEEIVQELIDTHMKFQNEKADLTIQAKENREKYNALNLEIVSLIEEMEKVKKLKEETLSSKRIVEDKLQEALETASARSLVHHKQVQELESDITLYKDRCRELEADITLYKDRCRELEKDVETAVKREQEFRLSGCSQLDKLRDELQSYKRKLAAAEETERSLSMENEAMLTSNTKLEVALDATRNRLEVFEGRLEEADWELTEFKSLLQKAGFMRGDNGNLVTLQQFERIVRGEKEKSRRLEEELASKKFEMIELEVEFESMRGQCEKYQEELHYLRSKVLTPEEEIEHKKNVTEMAEQNRKLQGHLRKAEDKAKEFQDMLRAKEADLIKLQSTLKVVQAENLRFEKELQLAQQLNNLARRAGAIAKPSTPIFRSATKHDKPQAQSASHSSASLRPTLEPPENYATPRSVQAAKETIPDLSHGSPVLKRTPLGENSAFTSLHKSEGKGARSFLTSAKLPLTGRPGSRGFIRPDILLRSTNKENLEDM